jgi:DNA-binding response OmpR family regulator
MFSKATVLVVEDDLDAVEMFQKLFQGSGRLIVEVVQTAQDAIMRIESRDPPVDLVLLDLDLHASARDAAVKAGIGLAVIPVAVRQDPPVPVIVVSGRKDAATMQEVTLAGGVLDYIKKPYAPRELLAKVLNILEVNRAFDKPYAFGRGYGYDGRRGDFLKDGNAIASLGDGAGLVMGELVKHFDRPISALEISLACFADEDLKNVYHHIGRLRKFFTRHQIPLEIVTTAVGRAGGQYILKDMEG